MARRRTRVHLSVEISPEHHAHLVEIAAECGVPLADVVRELVAFATKSRSKSDEIRAALGIDSEPDPR